MALSMGRRQGVDGQSVRGLSDKTARNCPVSHLRDPYRGTVWRCRGRREVHGDEKLVMKFEALQQVRRCASYWAECA